MRAVICGAGLVGYGIASYLSSENNDITVIDTDQKRIDRVNDNLDAIGIVGHGSDPYILEQAKIEDADLIIAVTSSDETNMVACQIAHSLFNVPKKIARIRRRSYTDPAWSNLFSRSHMPIDVIVSPEEEIAQSVYRSIEISGTTYVVPLAGGAVHIIGIICEDNCPIVNTPLRQLTQLFPDLNAEVISIVRGNRAILPDGDDQITQGDEVFLCVDTSHIQRVFAAFGKDSHKARRFIIVGGGDIGYRLAELLSSHSDFSVKLIEQSYDRSLFISEKLEHVTVLHGEGMNRSVLEEAGVENAETLISVTDDDEGNILGSILAKQFGCERVIALVNNTVYTPLINELAIDTALSPQAITISSIMQHVRRGRIKALHNIKNGFAEIIEAETLETSPIVGIPIEKLHLPKQLIIGAIVRSREVIIPKPQTVIKNGDRVILLATRGYAGKVERLFI